MTDKEVMQQALAALEGVLDDDKDVLKASISGGLYEVVDCQRSIASLRAAIAQSEQPAYHRAPMAFLCHGNLYMWPSEDDYCGNPEDHIPLYTIPHPAIAQPTIKESLTVQTIAQPKDKP